MFHFTKNNAQNIQLLCLFISFFETYDTHSIICYVMDRPFDSWNELDS